MSIHWSIESIPEYAHVTDDINRQFIYSQGRFIYHGRFITAADIDWPVLEGEPE